MELITGDVHTPNEKSQTASEIDSIRPIPDLTISHKLILDSLPKNKH